MKLSVEWDRAGTAARPLGAHLAVDWAAEGEGVMTRTSNVIAGAHHRPSAWLALALLTLLLIACSSDNGTAPAKEGACCYANGTCQVSTSAVCTGAGGTYHGDDSVCSPNPCPQPTPQGACCAPNGT